VADAAGPEWLSFQSSPGLDEPGFVGEDDRLDAVAEAELWRMRPTWALIVAAEGVVFTRRLRAAGEGGYYV
jgi:hypothetical protein